MNATILPGLDELGADLVGITPFRRRLALARPFLYLAGYGLAAVTGHWVLALTSLFLLFCADISAMHDAVHGTLGLRRRATDWTLFAVGALLLVSGHAYRRTHQQHHKVFPGPDDPEGEAARLTPLRCLIDGPLHVPRIWWWAFRRAPRRGWLIAEALVPFAALAGGLVLLPWTPALLVYVVLVVAGGWLYPLLTVYLPHHDYGDEPVKHAKTLRGRVLPTLLLEQTYHLEHHLYPRVPSYKLPELARRLDPHLRAAGVNPRRVP
jgi:beta-carotene hydroxylase